MIYEIIYINKKKYFLEIKFSGLFEALIIIEVTKFALIHERFECNKIRRLPI